MSVKYPQPGDVYHSKIYPGQMCRVLRVIDALVTFEWQGQYDHVEPQSAPVNRFVRDFTHQTGG